MRNRLIFLMVLMTFSTFRVKSQDLLVLQSGDSINCKINSMDDGLIKFTRNDGGEVKNSVVSQDMIIAFTKNFYGVEDDYVSDNSTNTPSSSENLDRSMITVGFLHGGGSLVGIDVEFLPAPHFGIQAGLGLLGYGGALHYHLKRKINSSSVALNYWHQGIGPGYVQSVIGPTFVFRAKKLLTLQLGIGGIIEEGPFFEEAYKNRTEPDVILMFSVGLHFPIKE